MRINVTAASELLTALFALAFIFSGFEASAEPGWNRDPFRFGPDRFSTEAGQAPERAPAKLEMILITDDLKIAVFNGRSYHVGDIIDGFKITEISLDSVISSGGGKEKVFKIYIR